MRFAIRLMVSILCVSTFFNAQSFAQEATSVLRQIHGLYSARFTSNGKYIDDSNLEQQFIQAQTNAIQTLRAQGNLGQSFKIVNSVKSELSVTVTLVTEKNGDFAGLLVERNQYAGQFEQSLLRLYNVPILKGGMDALRVDGNSIFSIQSADLSLSQGGLILIKYPTDYLQNAYDQTPIKIIKIANQFAFRNANDAAFSAINLEIWYSIFSQNFGIKSISFQ